MSQGERRGSLELVAVSMKAGTAKIRLEGAESTISMRTNASMRGPVAAAAWAAIHSLSRQGKPVSGEDLLLALGLKVLQHGM